MIPDCSILKNMTVRSYDTLMQPVDKFKTISRLLTKGKIMYKLQLMDKIIASPLLGKAISVPGFGCITGKEYRKPLSDHLFLSDLNDMLTAHPPHYCGSQ